MASNSEISLFKVFMAPPAEIDKPVEKLLHSGYVTQGKKVEEFEEHLRRFFGNVRRAAMPRRALQNPVVARRRASRPHSPHSLARALSLCSRVCSR